MKPLSGKLGRTRSRVLSNIGGGGDAGFAKTSLDIDMMAAMEDREVMATLSPDPDWPIGLIRSTLLDNP
jgi:hypothetical protein